MRLDAHGLSDSSREPGRIVRAPDGLNERQLAALHWNAQSQADRIMDYWRNKGHDEVRAWVHYTPLDGYQVRSNLVKGLPP